MNQSEPEILGSIRNVIGYFRNGEKFVLMCSEKREICQQFLLLGNKSKEHFDDTSNEDIGMSERGRRSQPSS